LLLNWLSRPHWSPVYFLLFEISSPMWPNRGFRCCLFLTLRITLNKYPEFWKEKLRAANGKAQRAFQVPLFFSFKFWGGVGGGFVFIFPLWG
jgi:hypothetical protein